MLLQASEFTAVLHCPRLMHAAPQYTILASVAAQNNEQQAEPAGSVMPGVSASRNNVLSCRLTKRLV